MAFIELDNISLTFHVRPSRNVTLKEYLIKKVIRRQSINPTREVRALQEVSFTVKQGQRLGVIGHNGAGKSTLLKLLAGIYPPSVGRRTVEGQVCSLFDLLLGLESEASGWENIGFRSYLHGETRRTVRARMREIAAFSELGDFLNMPVRFYSAGMLVRLAFSIATAIEPEVLLIDEALSAGDLGFQQKARARMIDLMERAHLMVVVSHDLVSLPDMCDRVLWLDHGRVRQIGPPDEIIAAYRASMESVPSFAA
jgi:ABC-type polysaccharide/polyol phosphate transport system ATPase subunit